MASILEVYQGTTTLLPGTTWAAPNGLFGATADRNDGSIYGWADSTSTITLPSSDLADGYLFLWGYEFEDTSNGRHNPQGRMQQASGTGTFVTATTGGYNRDNSEDRSYVSGWSFVDNPSASSTYQFEWKRDSDTPTGGTVRAFIQAVPFYYADIGLYTSTSTTATGGTTPTQISGFTGTDGTNITISSSQVSVTGDNKRYLCLGSAFHETMGGSRTQRWFGLEIDGTFDDAAKGCMYFRNTSNDEGGESFIRLIETATATRTIEVNQYRGDGVAAGQGGADVDGNTTSSLGAHALVVIELNDNAEVYSSTDSVGGQEFALTGPVDVDIASTGDIEFNDSASFTRNSDTAVNCVQTGDVFAFSNVSHAREASAIGSGQRWTVHGEFTINGTENTDVGFHGNYNRGNQSSQDCHGSSCNQAGVFAVTASDTIGVSNQELSGTEGGGGDIETQAGWVGFGLINIDTLEASGGTNTNVDPGAGSLTVTGQQPALSASDNVTEEPGAGSLTLTGYAPSRASGFLLQGYAPTVSIDAGDANHTATPGAGSLTVTGQTPTIDRTENHIVNPGVGSLTITGYAPSLFIQFIATPAQYDLTLDGLTPTIVWTDNHIRGPPVGSVSLTGYAPTIDRTENWIVTPDVSSLTLTGLVLTLDAGANIIEEPGVGSLTLTGYAPSAEIDHYRQPGAGSLALTGYAPTLDYSWTVHPSAGSLTLSSEPPAAVTGDSKIVTPLAGSATLTGYAPSAEITHNRAVPANSLTITGYAPSAEIDHFRQPGVGSLLLTTYAPQLVAAGAIVPDSGELTLTGYAPTVTNTSDAVVVEKATGGGRRKRRRYIVEVDGQFIEVATIADAEMVLQQARELAEVAVEKVDAPARQIPRVSVKLISGRETTSKVIKREVKRTQAVINRIYQNAQERIERDKEIARLMQAKLREEEDEEEALIALLL